MGGDGTGSKGTLPRAPRPDLCRRFARKQLAEGLPGILQRFVDEAQKGSIPHAKALASLAGLDKEGPVTPLPAKRGKRPGSLSEMLLTELRRRPVTVVAAGPETTTNGEARKETP